MVIKAVFGDKGHSRILECYDIHLENKGEYTELLCHVGTDWPPYKIHLGEKSRDHLYIMSEGKTVDHLIFEKH